MWVVKHKTCIFTKLHTNGVKMFGKRLKEIRKSLRYTQDEMASRLEIPYRTYTSYERDENKPSYSMLDSLCKNENVNLNWFISGEGNMFNAPQFEQVQDELAQKVRSILREEGLIK